MNQKHDLTSKIQVVVRQYFELKETLKSVI